MAKQYRELKQSSKMTFWIEKAQRDKMQALYLARGISISEQVRRALRAFLDAEMADLNGGKISSK